MKVSKLLVSTAAAVTVVGAIGFAFAQEGDNKANPKMQPQSNSSSSMNSGSTGSMNSDTGSMNNNTGMSNTGPTGAVGATTDTSNMANERMARNDRN